MPEAYDIHDAQFLQRPFAQSAANALSIALSAVPTGSVWTVLAAYVTCDVAETQAYWFSIASMGAYFPVTKPASFVLDPTTAKNFPLVTEGMEIKLFPGEQLVAHRDAATAGSVITIFARIVETDMQYYVELDKHKVLRRRVSAMIASEPAARGGMGGRTGGPPSREGRERPTRY